MRRCDREGVTVPRVGGIRAIGRTPSADKRFMPRHAWSTEFYGDLLGYERSWCPSRDNGVVLLSELVRGHIARTHATVRAHLAETARLP